MDQGAQKKNRLACNASIQFLVTKLSIFCNHYSHFEADEDFKRLESAINRVDIIKD